MARISLAQATELVERALSRAGAHGGDGSLDRAGAGAGRVAGPGLARPEPRGAVRHPPAQRQGQSARPWPQVLPARRAPPLLVDAHQGLAFPACDLAVATAVADRPRRSACVLPAWCNSHHAGVLVDHLRAVADAGMVGLGFANSPAAMPAAGGRHPIFGTNPVAAVFPRRGRTR
jgi:(2R)-3-sulfolactate dehydrogenase (NADP+)